MPELPADNSIVSIKSFLYGTYLSACSDHRSLTLVNVDDPNKLPQNCLWTLRSKPIAGFSMGSLRFISCYGRYLALKGLVWKEVCQDNPITGYARFWLAGWTYDRVGTTECHDRLRLRISAYFLTANKKNGEVSLHCHPPLLCTKPEIYWTIKQVGNNNKDRPIVPAMPPELPFSYGISADHDDRPAEPQGLEGQTQIYNFSTYNNPILIINSGMNVNKGGGDQCVGAVTAANTEKQYADFRYFSESLGFGSC